MKTNEIAIPTFPDGRMMAEHAAAYLGLSPKTLAMMRCRGNGPAFIKRGRIFYFRDDLDAWISSAPRVQSTTQAALGNRREA